MERRTTGTPSPAHDDPSHWGLGSSHQQHDGIAGGNNKTRKVRKRRNRPASSISSIPSFVLLWISRILKHSSVVRAALLSFSLVGIFSLFYQTHLLEPTRIYVSDLLSPFTLMPPTRINRRVNGTTLMIYAGYEARPRVIGYYYRDSTTESWMGVQRLDPNMKRRLTHANMDWTVEQTKAQVHLGDSLDYLHELRDELEVGDCFAQYEWQTVSFPTCNILHEFDLTDLRTSSHNDMRVKIVGNGYWRDVWVIKDNSDTSYALKTIRFQHDWADRNYDRHRRDAVASERLTASKNVVDIFGYCGNSGVFEYADGGDIETMLWYSDNKWNATERLIVAYQVAIAINDVHSYPSHDLTSISHTDIAMSQFVYIDGRYKLNDFNRCRFISINRETHQLCGFKVENNPGTFRSPEEYMYEMETEKIDIFAMGNVFYSLVTEQWPFQDDEKTIAQAKIMQGERPHIPSKFETSTEPAYKLLIKLMRMCWKQNPKERPTAKVVADLIENELRASGVKEDADS